MNSKKISQVNKSHSIKVIENKSKLTRKNSKSKKTKINKKNTKSRKTKSRKKKISKNNKSKKSTKSKNKVNIKKIIEDLNLNEDKSIFN